MVTFLDTESRMAVEFPGSGEEEEGGIASWLAVEFVLQDEKVLEIGYTVLWIYLTILNVHLKIVKCN